MSEIVKYAPARIARNLEEVVRLGDILARSGFFQDARTAAQCVVKVLAGAELGFPEIASMTGIYIVQGRVTLSANLIGAAIKRSGRYNYRVRRLDDAACEIEFFEAGESVGVSAFGRADAERAGLASKAIWRQYPRNMLFARALSNGARWFCPDVFNGPIYTPDELGAEVDESGEVVMVPEDATPEPEPIVEPAPATNGQSRRPARPWDAETLRAAIRQRAADYGDGAPSEQQLAAVRAALSDLTNGDDKRRHALTEYLLGKSSTKDLTRGECRALLGWINAQRDADGSYVPSELAVREAEGVYRAYQIERGQTELPLGEETT